MIIEGKITFDRAARWVLAVLAVCVAFFLLRYFSKVLLPFFVAWLFAYLMYPLVTFIQYRLHVRIRAVSIVLAMLTVLAALSLGVWLVAPPLMEQCGRFTVLMKHYLYNATNIYDVPETLRWWLQDNRSEIEGYLLSDRFSQALQESMPALFSVMGKVMSLVVSVVTSCITLLYMFFILLDYEYLSENWVRMFPKSVRPFWQELMKDVKDALNNYIRGQGLVALTMGILFCIGFSVIGLPMAIALGILIGLLDMVPYLHTFALIPAALLAAIKSAETGGSFWVELLLVVAVFCIVQVIIDAIVTPKIMSKKMGLNPAVLLLSLSLWGALLGFIGLIIALPATTIITVYWKRYITKEEERKPESSET